MTKDGWHTKSEKDIFKELETNLEGLDFSEVSKRQTKYGPNEPVTKKPKSLWWLVWQQFQSPIIYLLLTVALITFFVQHYIDTLVVLIIVTINTIIGFIQEVKAEKSLEALKKLVSLKAKVIREGEEQEIPSLELVPGDLVVLEAGVKVPADLRLIETENLKIDESSLTGESVAVHKHTKTINQKIPLADRINMAYASTVVTNGRGIGVVTQTATYTEIGQIAKEVVSTEEEQTPLHKRLAKFSRILLYAVVGLCALIFFTGILKGLDVVEMILMSISAAVSAIPEGLPAITTITLAVGVYRMAQQSAIVRKLQAVETLGSISIIASDKTGTLTHNQMTVGKIYLSSDDEVKISGKGYEPEGEFYLNNRKVKIANNKILSKLLTTGILCNDSKLVKEEKIWEIQGDPTEGSLVVAAAKANLHKDEIDKNHPRLDEIPFESEKQYMATLHKTSRLRKTTLAVKGTIEKILSCSTHYLTSNGRIKKLNSKLKAKILDKSQKEALNAHRILALAYRIMPEFYQKISQKDISSLVFLGFCSLEDPPREEAITAIKKCLRAGIRPIMITGDHAATGLAIGKRLGIAKDDSIVLSGEDLEKMTDGELSQKVKSVSIFARVTPKMKLKIVEALQKQGYVVGVTGDGVNDAPVLKRADVGIAMGKGGTDVAREAADMVLLDNNFATIINAIEEGRTIFLNIRRSVFHLLSTNTGEMLIIITALFLGLPFALIPVQILWINLVTDTTAGISLALEPKHIEVTDIPPRSPKEGILNNITNWRILFTALTMTIVVMILYKAELDSGVPIERARSIAFVSMAIFQIYNVFNSRSLKTSLFKMKAFSNKYLIWSFVGSFTLTIMTTQVGFMRTLFHTVPLTLADWIKICSACLVIFMVVELDKLVRSVIRSKYY